MTLAQLRSIVRTLTGVLATDLLTDVLCNALINESLFEIYRRQGAGWPFNQTSLVADGDSPPFEAQFHMAIAYRASAKVLNFVADTTNRGETFTAEFVGLVSDMEKFYLPKFANPSFVSSNIPSSGTFIQTYQRAVRDLSGLYDKQILSDGMLEEIINVAHTEFVNMRNWKFYNNFQQFPISAAPWTEVDLESKENTGVPPSHRLLLTPFGVFGQSALSYNEDTEDYDMIPIAGRTLENVKEVYLITGGPQGRAERMVYTDSLSEIDRTVEKLHYMTVILGNAQYLLFAPEQTAVDSHVRIVTKSNFNRISDTTTSFYDEEADEVVQLTFSTGFSVPPQFQMLLVYRAAQFALMQLDPEDSRISLYEQMYATMLEAFINHDQVSNDTRAFSLGERGKDEPRFIPRFRSS
jgi:hypothetical protein